MKILISACLLGYNVRYDGTNKTNDFIFSLKDKYELIPICPELFGGFNIPHPPIERKDDKVINNQNIDVTKIIDKGSRYAYKQYQLNDCKFAILKSKSPSCGLNQIYDGTFSGKLTMGDGYFSEYLKNHQVRVFSENDIDDILDYLKNCE